MFGNLVNNVQIRKLIDTNQLEIEPFSSDNMSLVYYTLHVGRVKIRNDADETWSTKHNFEEDANPFIVEPNDYVIVVVQERLKLLNKHLVGTFSPASTLIEQGFGLTAGKIDKAYGTTGEKYGEPQEPVIFGLKNNLNSKNRITPSMRVAHVSFFDLRGVASDRVRLSDAEEKRRRGRGRWLYAVDDGPIYNQDPFE